MTGSERQIDRQGTFSPASTRASIHETYGFSARLITPGQWEVLIAGLDVVLERESFAAGDEVRV